MFKLYNTMIFVAVLLLMLITNQPIFVLSCSSNTLTDLLGPFYLPNSPQTTVITPLSEANNPKKRLEVSGRILSTLDCNNTKYWPISTINIEVWYAGTPDSQGNYYQDTKYRGQLKTDDCGYYTFVQSFPVLYPDRPIRHTHIRLTDSNNNELLVTQMYFKGIGTSYYNARTIASVLNGVRHDLQAVTITRKRVGGTRRVKLNIFLNKAGNKECTGVSA